MQRNWLSPEHLRNLHVDACRHPRGQAHLSAASGLVQVDSHLFVVADDELHLGRIDAIDLKNSSGHQITPVDLYRLFDGNLPIDKDQRKKVKPDLETLALLPRLPGCPFGALLTLGSGSKPSRQTGVLLALDKTGEPIGPVTHIDLTQLYRPLRTVFPDLNIEGAFVSGGELLLLQRGNKGDPRNACIRYDWNKIAPWLAEKAAAPARPKGIGEIQLGEIDRVPLGLTDGAPLADGAWAFCAVAENTANSFQDGACVGSAVGMVNAQGQLLNVWWLEGAPKVEGIAVVPFSAGISSEIPSAISLNLVTDADDPALASQLLRVRLPTVL